MKFSKFGWEYNKMNKRMKGWNSVNLDENITRWIGGWRDEIQYIWMRILQDEKEDEGMKFNGFGWEYYKMNKRMKEWSLMDLNENITRWIRGWRNEVQWIWMRILQDE